MIQGNSAAHGSATSKRHGTRGHAAVYAAAAGHGHLLLHRRSTSKTVAAFAAVDASKLVVLPSTPAEYFPAADLHATCFGHSSTAHQAMFERFDRIWALQINDDLARRGAGNCSLLIAYDPDTAPQDVLNRAAEAAAAAAAAALTAADVGPQLSSLTSSSNGNGTIPAYQLPNSEQYGFPALGYWLSRMVERPVWAGLDRTYGDLGIVGVAQVDTFGDIIPPRTLNASRDGAVGWVKREGIAYISNVAVAPSGRRCGVAQRLMVEAESLAASWGCTRAGLHCNPTNEPAMQLYKRLRYRKGALEAPWMPYLQGRAPDRCFLLLKRIKQQQQQQQQSGGAATGVTAASSAAVLPPC